MAGSPLTGDFRAWERLQPTEWGPLPADAGGFLNADDPATKARFTTGVYSNTWENRAQSLNIEVVVDEAVAASYAPPLPVNPDNPTAWISLGAQGRSLGIVKFELKADLCPLAAENFMKLCESGVYRGSLMHRIIPGFCVQGGDYTIRSDEIPEDELFDLSLVEYRKGGRSIFSEVLFQDENSSLKHAGQGVLSMASEQRGQNGSQFFVMMGERAEPHLDRRYQAFGQVLSGMEVLQAVCCLGTTTGKVMQRVVMEDCGVGGPVSSEVTAAAGATAAPRRARLGRRQPVPPRLAIAAPRSDFARGTAALPRTPARAPVRSPAAVHQPPRRRSPAVGALPVAGRAAALL
eukprot:jgi/Tetstr1/465223/TSEL_009929.t1